jgi:sec-independent protein translocase protein TatB
MFDFDVGKLMVIGGVALIVIGPKDLPRVMRQVGNVVGKMRRMASEFQTQFMDAMREADVDSVTKDLKADLDKAADAVRIESGFDPLKDVQADLNKVLEDVPPPELAKIPLAVEAEAPAAPPESLDAAMDAAQPTIEAANAFEDMTLEPPTPSHPGPHAEEAAQPPSRPGPHAEEAAQPPSRSMVQSSEVLPPFETPPAAAPQDEGSGFGGPAKSAQSTDLRA